MSNHPVLTRLVEGIVPPARSVRRYGRVPPSGPMATKTDKGHVPPTLPAKPASKPVANPSPRPGQSGSNRGKK